VTDLHIPRKEEQQVRDELDLVRDRGRSRTVLLYGQGGVGKTQLLRELVRTGDDDAATVWVDPIDVDDSEYWLLSNLERKVVEQLDPGGVHFGSYLQYLSELPRYERPDIGYESVVSHLNRIKRVFTQCYHQYVKDGDRTVVISFDTIEAIRGMALMMTLTQWIKALPNTLFILAGRPLSPGTGPRDLLEIELDDPHQRMPTRLVRLGGFDHDAAMRFFATNQVSSELSDEEQDKLAHLTLGHPLWAALTLNYLRTLGIPDEANQPAGVIRRLLPFDGTTAVDGARLVESFKRRLVTPYRSADFWHEATKRLAVVRKNVNCEIWRELMADRSLPDGVADWDAAWQQLLSIPWIRPRANRRFVTLHDAFADELAQRVIPLHDQDRRWRQDLWRRTIGIYERLISNQTVEVGRERDAIEERFRTQADHDGPDEQEMAFIAEVGRHTAAKRDLDQLRTAHLYYQLLLDPADGGAAFQVLFDQARDSSDILFQTLIALEVQRLLPGPNSAPFVDEAISGVVDELRFWLKNEGREIFVEIGIRLANYLLATERPEQAIATLASVPEEAAGLIHNYRIHNLRGNAHMRMPGQMAAAERYFQDALTVAEGLDAGQRYKYVAEAHKELGYYYRNKGLWGEADEAYRRANNAIWASLSSSSPAQDQGEMASIRTNWAYLKGLCGNRHEGLDLVHRAIQVRKQLNQRPGEASGWSVFGELQRFEGEYASAWDCYLHAEEIFSSLGSWSWLAQIQQQQAICAFQAAEAGIDLAEVPDPYDEAERRIQQALDLSHDQALRGYPAALNRAGRIFARRDIDRGIRYLETGVEQARQLSDGWFLLSNIVELAELSYEAWNRTGEQEHLKRITKYRQLARTAMGETSFPYLNGRWHLVQGYIAAQQAMAADDRRLLDNALPHFTMGFRSIAEGYHASHGTTRVSDQFAKFKELFQRLPSDVRSQWESSLRGSWGESITLQASLEELY
jgi:tetratricopeptide (TPR) repeat protein